MALLAAGEKANGFKDTTSRRHETAAGERGGIETRIYTAVHESADC
ncbi:MAG: hypothetical protein WBW81_00300 [Methylocella sp.]